MRAVENSKMTFPNDCDIFPNLMKSKLCTVPVDGVDVSEPVVNDVVPVVVVVVVPAVDEVVVPAVVDGMPRDVLTQTNINFEKIIRKKWFFSQMFFNI